MGIIDIKTEVEIDFYCGVCGKSLDVKYKDWTKTSLVVDPCVDCVEEARDEGRAEGLEVGRKEGLEVGRKEGIELSAQYY